ncbi:MAG: hypothetical protein ACSLE3_10855, partial [Microbacteriaceae bacterium]
LTGSSDPWTEVEQISWSMWTIFGPPAATPYPDADNPTHMLVDWLSFMGADTSMPVDLDAIDLVVLCSRGEVSEALPFYAEGIAAGELVRRAYDGELSPRGFGGTLVPTGIRYAAAALAAMTTPVRFRLTAPVPDVRAWLEANVYAPLGLAPALDSQGRISPVSQVPPDTATGLLVLHNGIVEPLSDWGSGDRIINVIRFTYLRDFQPGPGPTYGSYPLEEREVIVEYRDEPSITRHGEQVLDIAAGAFRAVGKTDGEALSTGQQAETGWILSDARALHLLDRYSYGAPSMRFPVLRTATPGLRAGSWVVIDLSWLPDYLTSRRGLLALGQVIALNDLDCHWREALVELAGTLPAS